MKDIVSKVYTFDNIITRYDNLQSPLAELEYIFQTHPNVIGLVEGETFWNFMDSQHLWLMGNADSKGDDTDDHTTRLRLTLNTEPIVSGNAYSSWSNGTLSLTLGQSTGAIEAIIELSLSTSSWIP